jgi:hypothetical protein
MARKRATRAEFVLFDVFYEDGSQRSNRRVPSEILGGIDGDAPARAAIEEQDRLIVEKSGNPAVMVKSIRRSGERARSRLRFRQLDNSIYALHRVVNRHSNDRVPFFDFQSGFLGSFERCERRLGLPIDLKAELPDLRFSALRK